jgi:hypothetical protein
MTHQLSARLSSISGIATRYGNGIHPYLSLSSSSLQHLALPIMWLHTPTLASSSTIMKKRASKRVATKVGSRSKLNMFISQSLRLKSLKQPSLSSSNDAEWHLREWIVHTDDGANVESRASLSSTTPASTSRGPQSLSSSAAGVTMKVVLAKINRDWDSIHRAEYGIGSRVTTKTSLAVSGVINLFDDLRNEDTINANTKQWLAAIGHNDGYMIASLLINQIPSLILREMKDMGITRAKIECARSVLAAYMARLTCDYLHHYNWIIYEKDPQRLYIPLTELPRLLEQIRLTLQQQMSASLHDHNKGGHGNGHAANQWRWRPSFIQQLTTPSYDACIGNWHLRHFQNQNEWHHYIKQHAPRHVHTNHVHVYNTSIKRAIDALYTGGKFVAFDVEAYEFDQSKILEIGLSTLTPRPPSINDNTNKGRSRSINNRSDGSWPTRIENEYDVTTKHWIISEYAHLRNSQYVSGHPDRFNFGTSITISIDKIKAAIDDAFNDAKVFVGAGIDGDVKFLKRLGVTMNNKTLSSPSHISGKSNGIKDYNGTNRTSSRPINDNGNGNGSNGNNGLHTLDVQHINKSLYLPSITTSLHVQLTHHDIPFSYLHNAGNDSHYTMLLLLRQLSLYQAHVQSNHYSTAPSIHQHYR